MIGPKKNPNPLRSLKELTKALSNSLTSVKAFSKAFKMLRKGAPREPIDPIIFAVDEITLTKINNGQINAILIPANCFLNDRRDITFEFMTSWNRYFTHKTIKCIRKFKLEDIVWGGVEIQMINTTPQGINNAVRNLGYSGSHSLQTALNVKMGEKWEGYLVDFEDL